jgi:hypothetical protein
MFSRQERIKRRNAGKCDSPCLQYYGIPNIAKRDKKTPLQLAKAGK